METEKYKAFKNEEAEIQRVNKGIFDGIISEYYHFGEDDKTLIWTDKGLIPTDIKLKISQAAAKYFK